MRKRTNIILVLFIFLFVSCSADQAPNPSTWLGNFELFWRGMSRNYAFWGHDSTDWDSLYDEYRPKFASLDASVEADNEKAFRYIYEMTRNFSDGHFAVAFSPSLFPSRNSKSIIMSPSIVQRYLTRYDGISEDMAYDYMSHANSDNYQIHQEILETDLCSLYNSDLVYNAIQARPSDIVYAIDIENKFSAAIYRDVSGVVYFTFSAFQFISYINSYLLGDVSDVVLDVVAVYKRFVEYVNDCETTGLIIDLRANEGGAVDDGALLWGALIEEKRQVGYSRYKVGENRLEYGEYIPYFVNPIDYAKLEALGLSRCENKTFYKPIAVIINTSSVSMAELSTLFFKTFANSKVFGVNSFGGLGVITGEPDVLNAGVFNTGFLSLVYTPSAVIYDLNKNLVDGVGIAPDERVEFDFNSFFSVSPNKTIHPTGKDTMLDCAREWINAAIKGQV